METRGKMALGRRRFLHAVGAGVAATAAVPLAKTAKADGEKKNEKRKSRYRESDHVKRFYQVNRYPS